MTKQSVQVTMTESVKQRKQGDTIGKCLFPLLLDTNTGNNNNRLGSASKLENYI